MMSTSPSAVPCPESWNIEGLFAVPIPVKGKHMLKNWHITNAQAGINDFFGVRPLDSQADQIAAAAPMGKVYQRALCEVMGERWQSPGSQSLGECKCWNCTTPSIDYWRMIATNICTDLDVYKTTWDPKIRF